MTEAIKFRPMTDVEKRLVRALALCTMHAATFDRRFAQSMKRESAQLEPKITEKQAETLRKLITRYRRQIRPDELPESERHLLEESKKGGES